MSSKKIGRRLWKREEIIFAMGLYFSMQWGKIHHTNPEIIQAAQVLGRTPDSLVYKLGNIGRQRCWGL